MRERACFESELKDLSLDELLLTDGNVLDSKKEIDKSAFDNDFNREIPERTEFLDEFDEKEFYEISDKLEKDDDDEHTAEETSLVTFENEYESGELEKIRFPSGVILEGKPGSGAKDSTYYDPNHSSNPLLSISGRAKRLNLSKNFKVKEFITTRGKVFRKARIDPNLVELIQNLRTYLNKSITIITAYQSYAYRKRRRLSLDSLHLSGRAAVIKVRGMQGLELAKEVIYASECQIGVYAGQLTVRLEVFDEFRYGSYIKNRKANFYARYELSKHHRLKCELPKEIKNALEDRKFQLAVQFLIHYGIRDEKLLTDMIFFPLWWRQPRKINKNDKGQLKEWIRLRNRIVRPTLGIPSPPIAQKSSVVCLSEGERVLADEQPEAPTIDITGRYEAAVGRSQKVNGYTLSINQAGKHIECVGADVPKPYNPEKVIYRLQGELQDDGTFLVFERTFPYLSSKFIPLKNKKLGWRYKVSTGYKIDVFSKTSYSPILFDNAVSLFPFSHEELIGQSQWHPLIKKQIRHLQNSLTPEKLDPHLRNYFKTEYGNKSYQKVRVVKAASKIENYIHSVFTDEKYGIHENSNLELARFYASSILTARTWLYDYKRQSLLDWLQYILNLVAAIKPKERFSSIRKYLGLGGNPAIVMGKKLNKYKVKLDLRKKGFGLMRYSGKITIKKTTLPYWSSNREETFNIVFWAGGVDKGFGGKVSIEGRAESYYDWQPNHIPGPFMIGRLVLEIGYKKIGATGSAGFMHIKGADYMPVLHATFAEAEFGGSGIDFGGIAGLTGEIKRKDLPIKEIKRPLPKTDYATEYKLSKDVHFCFNSALLTEDARQALRIMCANELPAFMSRSSRLKITAHTDRVGKPKDNFTLSDIRAANTLQAIEDLLGNKFQIPKENQKAEGKGEAEAEKAKHPDNLPNPNDRRVDIFINGRSVLSLRAEGSQP